MRLSVGTLIANSEILPGVHLLEIQASQLAQTAQPGQYCLIRCCDSQASDPLLRRPFFVAGIETGQKTCQIVVHRRGRASNWLAQQQPGSSIDLWGPLGHGWTVRPETSNLLLIGEDPLLPALLMLASHAIEQELSVTLLHCISEQEQGYPPALLPPEIEYQVMRTAGEPKLLAERIGTYLAWADTICASVSESLLEMVSQADTRWREKKTVQAMIARPLMCIAGTCLACQIETRHGPRLVCRDGPVFALRDLAGEW